MIAAAAKERVAAAMGAAHLTPRGPPSRERTGGGRESRYARDRARRLQPAAPNNRPNSGPNLQGPARRSSNSAPPRPEPRRQRQRQLGRRARSVAEAAEVPVTAAAAVEAAPRPPRDHAATRRLPRDRRAATRPPSLPAPRPPPPYSTRPSSSPQQPLEPTRPRHPLIHGAARDLETATRAPAPACADSWPGIAPPPPPMSLKPPPPRPPRLPSLQQRVCESAAFWRQIGAPPHVLRWITDPATSVELPRMLLLAIVLVGPRT